MAKRAKIISNSGLSDPRLYISSHRYDARFGIRIYVKRNSQKKMNKLFKTLIAGYGAKKLGGGCLSTVVIFIVIWVLLDKCS
jgi:hypothetical protein